MKHSDLLKKVTLCMIAGGVLMLSGCVVAPAYPGYVRHDAVIGVAPYPGYIWFGGYWGYRSHARYWVPGHWGPPR